MKQCYFTNEFERRLRRVFVALQFAFDHNQCGEANKTGDLFPSLFSLYSFMWLRSKFYKDV